MSPHHYHHRNPKALLTPAMHKVLDAMARAGHVPLHALSPRVARMTYAAGAGVLEPPAHKLARVEEVQIPVRDGSSIAARLYAPSHAVLPVLVYFHGGGFVIGSVATHDGLCRQLSHLAQCAVLSVDYRLAPEHKFPTAHNDAWDAVQWVAQQGPANLWDVSRIALGGDSAGGTLAAACAIEARNAGLALALQLLFYPGCAGHQNTPSHRTFGHGFVLEEPHITFFFDHYVRDVHDRDDWRFAPMDGLTSDGQVADLSGVAPAWIGLAECDPLVDEGIQYADRLRMAGVKVDLEIYRGVVHEFIKMGRAVPQAAQAHGDAARALRVSFA
jgi:acetyl esterase